MNRGRLLDGEGEGTYERSFNEAPIHESGKRDGLWHPAVRITLQ